MKSISHVIAVAMLMLACEGALAQLLPVPSREAKPDNWLRISDDGSALVYFPASSKGSTTVIPLHNQIQVKTRVSIHRKDDVLIYTYDISALDSSPDLMAGFSMIVSSEDASCRVEREASDWSHGACSNHTSPVSKQDLLGGAQGKWATWSSPDNTPLQRGRRINLTLTSEYLPGLCVAYLDGATPVTFPPDFDFDDISEKDIKRLDVMHTRKHFVTICPRYAPSLSKQQIATDILAELNAAISSKAIAESPWLSQVSRRLEQLSAVANLDRSELGVGATTPFEQDLTDALRFTFSRQP